MQRFELGFRSCRLSSPLRTLIGIAAIANQLRSSFHAAEHQSRHGYRRADAGVRGRTLRPGNDFLAETTPRPCRPPARAKLRGQFIARAIKLPTADFSVLCGRVFRKRERRIHFGCDRLARAPARRPTARGPLCSSAWQFPGCHRPFGSASKSCTRCTPRLPSKWTSPQDRPSMGEARCDRSLPWVLLGAPIPMSRPARHDSLDYYS